ncbi:MAG: DUF5603 domain-containing protein [Desulfurococcaceae archaeon]
MGSRCEISIKIPSLHIPYIVIEPLLMDIDKLVIHEEIVESRLDGLIKRFLKDKAVDMPIVISPINSQGKYMIIDGHHRWAAVKNLGLTKIPSVIVDYFNPSIELKTWYPGITGDMHHIIEELSKKGIDVEKCGHGLGDIISGSNIFSENISFIAISKDSCFEINGGLEGQKLVTRVLDKLCSNELLSLIYYGEINDAVSDIIENKLSYIFIRRALTKEIVVSKVKEGYVFPPKTTRHILPFYPAKVFTPLSVLK